MASGALWVLLGLFVLVVGRRKLDALLLGATAVAFGAQFLTGPNLALVFPDLAEPIFVAAYVFSGLTALFMFALAWRTGGALRTRIVIAALLLGGAAVALGLEWEGYLRNTGLSGAQFHLAGRGIVASAFQHAAQCALLAALALDARRTGDLRMRAVALAFGLFNGYNLAVLLGIAGGAGWALLLGGFVLAASAWVFAGAPGRTTAWLLLATPLAGAAFAVVAEGTAGPGVAVGVLRTIGVAVLARAVFKDDVLGVSLPRVAVHRGAATATALAVLFVVAQVAQNFFEAQYGLLMGGVVAGAFLFAAQPIQRAFEGLTQDGVRRVETAGTSSAPDAVRREEVYRKALRVALRDRALTRDEETHLHELAEELGIGAGRAHALLVEVEREHPRGVR